MKRIRVQPLAKSIIEITMISGPIVFLLLNQHFGMAMMIAGMITLLVIE